jgi:LacI family transcriptional regulator
MRDVAARAGVSQSAVSFVVNDRHDMRIKAETRTRILEAVEELGFRPDLTARSLRTQSTKTIGLFADEIAASPFAGPLLQGAQDEALANGLVVLMVNSGAHGRDEVGAVDALLDRRVDGMIYAALTPYEIVVPARMAEASTVLTNCFAAPETGLPAILPDEEYGGFLAAQAVLELGHRDILYLAGDREAWATDHRVTGFRHAVENAGLEFREGLVSYGDYQPESGYDRVMELAKREPFPTALLCANDRVALGVLFALSELGLSVPADVSVIGYDDEYLAGATHPALTTVSLPHYELGATSIRTLLAVLANETVPSQQLIKGELVSRGSLGAPRTS